MTEAMTHQQLTQLEAVKKRLWCYLTPDFGCGLDIRQLQQVIAGTLVPDAATTACMARRMQLDVYPL